ncbi:MAG TPA: 50S ribosomal protein L19 [Candidatus Dojkabacteria bacterium]|nr:50S ribosomal protein L19 [Candidatus Dojkabacteria bacterium]HQF37131.1 50S ribosomal protein L19 [Candidatus Dojkabacteria bacterium]
MKETKATSSKITVGDKVTVSFKIVEKDKERIQLFKGLVIAENGSGKNRSITVRKVSYGVGVERVFPLNCPSVEKVELVSKGTVRRSKLYYMRDRIGKKAMKISKEEIL